MRRQATAISRRSGPQLLARVLAVAVTATATAGLTGCGVSSLPKTASLSTETDNNSPFPTTGSEPKEERPPNPLADPTAGTAGAGREVIASPTQQDILATGPLPDRAYGSPTAPVTIVEYASLTCPHCRRFHLDIFPEFKRTYIDTGKVRYILREFPIGRTSGMATIALRCAPEDKYLELFGKYMEQQSAWVSQEVRLDPIFNVAKQVGMKRETFDACRQNQTMIEGLKWVKERGRKLGVIGTPNFFVGTQRITKVLTMEEIRALVEPALQQRPGNGAGQGAAPATAGAPG